MGPPGSGTGTQAGMLAKKYGFKHIQSGKVMRDIAESKTEFGKKVKKELRKGFVPSEWIFKITKEELSKVDESDSVILDSFSKILPEAEMLYEVLSAYDRKLDYIFLIKASRKEIFKRLLKRVECRGCGKTLSLENNKSLICGDCGKKIQKRDDDNLKSIENRINDFNNKTSLVIEYIKKKDKVIEINGEQPIEKVFEDIDKNIKI